MEKDQSINYILVVHKLISQCGADLIALHISAITVLVLLFRVVLPEKDKDGRGASIKLATACIDNLKYIEETDECK